MEIRNIGYQNNTTFGTRYGRGLSNFIIKNKDKLSHDNFKNLSMIRNNGLNSILDIEEASLKEKEIYHYKYNIVLKGSSIDKKNEIMNGHDDINYRFNDYITGRYTGNPIVTDNRFPIHIKNTGNDTVYQVLKEFDSKNMLVEKIEKEHKESKIVEQEFDRFSDNFNK